MAVPEATMREDYRSIARKHDVRPSGQFTIVQAEPESECMQSMAKDQFGLCVGPANPRHHSAADVGSNYISHMQISVGGPDA